MGKRIYFEKEDYLKGLKEVTQNLQNAVDKLEHKSVQGLADALVYVGTLSQNKAPVELGDLRGSLEIDIDGIVIAKGIPSKMSDEEKKSLRKRIRKGGAINAEAGKGIETVAEPPENGKVGTISYNTPYAADQHEQVNYDHKNGQAKYLESVLTSEKDRILELIAGGIMNDLEEF